MAQRTRKQDKYTEFCRRKYDSMKKFGNADIRPQDVLIAFLIHRRQLNQGLHDEKWENNSMVKEIRLSSIEQELLKNHKPVNDFVNLAGYIQPSELFTTPLIIVRLDSEFDEMILKLHDTAEMMIDLEGNTDHSYLGMTCTIQISTRHVDYIIDAIQLQDRIIRDLKLILQSTKCTKYFFGIANDALQLKRDFFIDLVQALDVQILFQHLLKDGVILQLCKGLPQKLKWFRNYVDKENKHGKQSETGEIFTHKMLLKEKSLQPMSYDAICQLFYPEIQLDKDGQVADHRRRSGPKYNTLLEYGRNDVHILFHIVDFLKARFAQLGIAATPYFNAALNDTKPFLCSLYGRKKYDSDEKACPAWIPDVEKAEWKRIYKWRDHMAKIYDESPEAMWNKKAIGQIIGGKLKFQNQDSDDARQYNIELLQDVILSNTNQTRNRIDPYPETLGKSVKGLLEILRGGPETYDRFMNIECHNHFICKTRGHLAWGCHEWFGKSTDGDRAASAEARHHENRRRRLNKLKNKRERAMGLQNAQQAVSSIDNLPAPPRGRGRGYGKY